MSQAARSTRNQRFLRLLIIAPIILVGLLYFSRAYGAELPLRSVTLSTSVASAQAFYKLGFALPAPETLGSVKLQFCANSPLVGDICNAPAGFDISGAALGNQAGEIGFSILPSGTNTNTVTLTRAPLLTTAGSVSYEFGGVINPSAGGTFYGRVQTFASIDASGADNEEGGMALSISEPVNISTVVPPYLLFCLGVTIAPFDCSTASGSYVNFGNLSEFAASSGTTQILTATNAGNGYVMTVNGTTMISGNNVINNIAAADVSRPGVGQFGLNFVANTTPNVGANPQGAGAAAPAAGYNTPNFYKFNSGDVVATLSNTDAYRLFTTSYIVNVPHAQPVGVYVATLTYICLANF